ncbi:MAG: hypothetical protein L3K08_02245 [Thermoplasmata archaeon]|nr:hypothetical protein [Thermoplasmata archaeon]
MRVRASLTFGPSEARPTGEAFTEEPRRRGRPSKQYRLRIRGPADVEIARGCGLPVYLLTPGRVAELGIPADFPPHVLIGQELDAAVDTDYPRIIIRYGENLQNLRLEDLVAALLTIDPLTARALAIGNRKFVDPERLARRTVEEGVVGPATRVGLQVLAPSIPKVGPTWSKRTLEEHDRGHSVTGLRA